MHRAHIGFIGAGNFITANHLPTAQLCDWTEIRGIADLDEKRLAKHTQCFDVGYTTTDYRQLLNDDDIDIVIIGTKQDLHAPMIVESLDAGKWVLCEKPMSETESESRSVLAAEQRNAGRFAIGFNRRFAPAYKDLKALMQSVPRPWYINYRLMFPNPHKNDSFYGQRERILYEGCHILDMVCWLLDAYPARVYMTGDRYHNNCCTLEYADGSQVCFMCGSMGSYCLWKENIEVFGTYTAITINEFTDMRVRGIPNAYDRLYAPFRQEHAQEIEQYGFDFYDVYHNHRYVMPSQQIYREQYDMHVETIRRPTPLPFDVDQYQPEKDLWSFTCDKGVEASVTEFTQAFLDQTTPQNADATAGANATHLAQTLLASLESGQPQVFVPITADHAPRQVLQTQT